MPSGPTRWPKRAGTAPSTRCATCSGSPRSRWPASNAEYRAADARGARSSVAEEPPAGALNGCGSRSPRHPPSRCRPAGRVDVAELVPSWPAPWGSSTPRRTRRLPAADPRRSHLRHRQGLVSRESRTVPSRGRRTSTTSHPGVTTTSPRRWPSRRAGTPPGRTLPRANDVGCCGAPAAAHRDRRSAHPARSDGAAIGALRWRRLTAERWASPDSAATSSPSGSPGSAVPTRRGRAPPPRKTPRPSVRRSPRRWESSGGGARRHPRAEEQRTLLLPRVPSAPFS